jgi:hypothetical protein
MVKSVALLSPRAKTRLLMPQSCRGEGRVWGRKGGGETCPHLEVSIRCCDRSVVIHVWKYLVELVRGVYQAPCNYRSGCMNMTLLSLLDSIVSVRTLLSWKMRMSWQHEKKTMTHVTTMYTFLLRFRATIQQYKARQRVRVSNVHLPAQIQIQQRGDSSG